MSCSPAAPARGVWRYAPVRQPDLPPMVLEMAPLLERLENLTDAEPADAEHDPKKIVRQW